MGAYRRIWELAHRFKYGGTHGSFDAVAQYKRPERLPCCAHPFARDRLLKIALSNLVGDGSSLSITWGGPPGSSTCLTFVRLIG